MIKQFIVLIFLSTCAFAVHASYLTIHNATAKNLSYRAMVCHPVKAFHDSFVQVVPEGNIYLNENCQGPVAAKIIINEARGVVAIKAYLGNFSIYGHGFEITIDQ